MPWLSFDWIALNWMPLAVAALLGLILGWLFIGVPAGRRANDAAARAAELEGRVRKAERDLNESRREGEAQRSRLLVSGDDLDKSRVRVSELESTLTKLRDERLALEAEMHKTEVALTSVLAEDEAPAIAAGAASEDVAGDFAGIARSPEPIVTPSARDLALDEVVGRAASLQHDLAERDAILAMRHAELETLKSELLTSNAARRELEARLVRAREDVAAELAVLASTMIKLKDDALARAEARYSALQAEADTLRTAAERATQTAD